MNRKHTHAKNLAAILVAVLLFGLYPFAAHPALASSSVLSSWEFAGWQYRKEHNVTLYSGNQTDYPVNFIVNYGGGTMEWVTKTPMPYALADVATATYNGDIYVFGGYGANAADLKNYTLSYDPPTDTWTKLADMPTARWGTAAAEYNGIIYVFGGTLDGDFLDGTTEVDGYNVTSNSWQNMTALPSNIAQTGLMAVTVDNNIYLFWGNYAYAFDPSANGGLGGYTQLAYAPINRS